MTYFEMVKEDLKKAIIDYEVDWKDDADSIKDTIYEQAWVDDFVTGNGTDDGYQGNYSDIPASEMVKENLEYVVEALTEFCVPAEELARRFINGDYEYLDITARCYTLCWAISEVVDKRKEEM